MGKKHKDPRLVQLKGKNGLHLTGKQTVQMVKLLDLGLGAEELDIEFAAAAATIET